MWESYCNIPLFQKQKTRLYLKLIQLPDVIESLRNSENLQLPIFASSNLWAKVGAHRVLTWNLLHTFDSYIENNTDIGH